MQIMSTPLCSRNELPSTLQTAAVLPAHPLSFASTKWSTMKLACSSIAKTVSALVTILPDLDITLVRLFWN